MVTLWIASDNPISEAKKRRLTRQHPTVSRLALDPTNKVGWSRAALFKHHARDAPGPDSEADVRELR
jgi:hypothetical protein